MAFAILIGTVTLLILLIASCLDFKTREVPDWLSYGFIFAALGIRAIFSFQEGWNFLVSGILGLAVGFILACLFYYTRQWGGGDSKLLMGMGAAIGIDLPFRYSSLTFFGYFLLVLFLGAFYGLAWMSIAALRSGKEFMFTFKQALKAWKILHLSAWLTTAVLTGSVMLSFFFRSLFFPFFFFSFAWIIVPFPLIFFYLFLFVSSVEKSRFIKQVPVGKLTEGDWLAEDVVVRGEVLMKKKTLEKKDLMELKNLYLQRKINQVTIKEGVPFTPSFLLAYLVLIFGEGMAGGIL